MFVLSCTWKYILKETALFWATCTETLGDNTGFKWTYEFRRQKKNTDHGQLMCWTFFYLNWWNVPKFDKNRPKKWHKISVPLLSHLYIQSYRYQFSIHGTTDFLMIVVKKMQMGWKGELPKHKNWIGWPSKTGMTFFIGFIHKSDEPLLYLALCGQSHGKSSICTPSMCL